MKITAQNLNGIEGPISVDINQNTYIVGPNGSGKSTLCKVPYYILTGQELSTKNGFSQSFAEMEFQGYKITRTSVDGKDSLYLNGTGITASAISKEFAAHDLLIDFFTEIFRPEVEFSNDTIIKMANIKINNDTVKKLCDFPNGSHAIPMLNDYLANNPITNIDDINTAYKLFYNSRTAAKKELASVSSKLSALDTPDASENVNELTKTLKTVSEQKESIRQEIEHLQRKIGIIISQNNQKTTLEKNIEELKLSKEKAEKNAVTIASLQKQIDEYSHLLSQINSQLDELKEKGKEMNQLSEIDREKKTEITEKINKINVEKASAQTKINMYQKQVESFEKGGICPLAAGFVCPNGSTQVIPKLKAEIEYYTQDIEDYDEELKQYLDDLQKITEAITRKNEERDKLSTERDELSTKANDTMKEYNNLVNQMSALRAGGNSDPAFYEKMIAEKEKELAAITVEEVESLSKMVEEKQESYRVLNERETEINRSILNVTQYQQLEKEKTDKANIVSGYESLVKTFKNLPNVIFAKIAQPLQQAGDAVLATLKPEWHIQFVPDKKGIAINICSDENGEVARENLSTGEKVILDYLLKNIGCQLTGFDTILVDNLDTLDEKNTENLMECIKNSPYKTLCISSIIPDKHLDMFNLINWYL